MIESMGPPRIPSQLFLHVLLAVEALFHMNFRPAALPLHMLHVLFERLLRGRQSKAPRCVMGAPNQNHKQDLEALLPDL